MLVIVVRILFLFYILFANISAILKVKKYFYSIVYINLHLMIAPLSIRILSLLQLALVFQVLAAGPDDTLSIQNEVNKPMLTTAIVTQSVIYVGGISYLSFVWYKDHERVPFHFYNDNAGYLQMDKFGHAYAAYLESYVCYNWLRKAGVPKNKSLLYGGAMGLVLQTPIEIFDGMYEGWGFSWGDMAANAAGSALLIGQELLFDEQVFRHKFSFSKSEYFDRANGYLGNTVFESFFYDYNSHTHWLSVNANRFFLKDKLPSWINVSVGYSANGMFGEFENRQYYRGARLPNVDRTRQFLLSLDIDWEKIPTDSRFLKGLFKGLNFIKLPFPAIEMNSKGEMRAYGLYF
jgi:hypothetical protein